LSRLKRDLEDILEADDLNTYGPEIKNSDYISRFHPIHDGAILTIRGLETDDDEIKTNSTSYIIQNEKVYYFNPDEQKCILLANGHDSILQKCTELHARNKEIVKIYLDEVDNLEDFVYDRKIPSYFMDIWFGQKKSILKIDRYYYRLLPVLKEYFKEYSDLFIYPHESFFEEIKFTLGQTTSSITKLDNIHH
jgi:hypothetical protein